MPTSISGSVSLSQVNTELGNSSTAQINMNDTNVRNLAGKSSGVISLNDLRGAFKIVIGSSTAYTTYGGVYSTSYGYYPSSYGSLGNTSFPDGKYIGYFYDVIGTSGPTTTELCIAGFSSDPGATGYFTSIQLRGYSTFNASAATYSYSSGYAYWTWNTPTAPIGLSASGTRWCKFS